MKLTSGWFVKLTSGWFMKLTSDWFMKLISDFFGNFLCSENFYVQIIQINFSLLFVFSTFLVRVDSAKI